MDSTNLRQYKLPFKSNFNGMRLVPIHYTLIVMKRNMTMPTSLLPKWNGTRAIPPYNGCIGWDYDKATFYTT
jgi:hypothetical protein